MRINRIYDQASWEGIQVGIRVAAVVFTTIAHLALLGSCLSSWTDTAPTPKEQDVVHVRLILSTAPLVPIARTKRVPSQAEVFVTSIAALLPDKAGSSGP